MANLAKRSTLSFERDQYGKEILLKDGSLQVMMEWEKPYMEACVEALNPQGDILEIGFGLGYSADAIQKHQPKSHTIIECDPVVLKRAREWAKDKPSVKILEGMWQDELSRLGQFDAIFFDDYAPPSKDEAKEIQERANTFKKRADNFNQIIDFLSEQLSRYENIKFSDQDVQDFLGYLDSRHDVTGADVLHFMTQLESQGNITKEQKTTFTEAFRKKNVSEKPESSPISLPAFQDRLLKFYELCLTHHMHSGSKLCSYIDYQEFKEREKSFRESFLQRPDIRFTEKLVDVSVPENCNYYSGDKGLILVIEKK